MLPFDDDIFVTQMVSDIIEHLEKLNQLSMSIIRLRVTSTIVITMLIHYIITRNDNETFGQQFVMCGFVCSDSLSSITIW